MVGKFKISTDNETWFSLRDGEILDNVTSPEVHKNFLTDEELRGYYKGNTLKYLLRERNKNCLEDLKKARKHLDLLIELEERWYTLEDTSTKKNMH